MFITIALKLIFDTTSPQNYIYEKGLQSRKTLPMFVVLIDYHILFCFKVKDFPINSGAVVGVFLDNLCKFIQFIIET